MVSRSPPESASAPRSSTVFLVTLSFILLLSTCGVFRFGLFADPLPLL